MSSLFLFVAAGNLLEKAQKVGLTFGWNPWLFLSQCISFGLVCVLLYKFAYHPILAFLEARRQKIEQGLEDARKSREMLAASERNHAEILSKANGEAQKMIDEARATSQALRERGAAQATEEAEAIRKKARDDAQQEHARMLAQLRKEVARLVVDTTGRVINRTLSDDDRKRLSDEATREITA